MDLSLGLPRGFLGWRGRRRPVRLGEESAHLAIFLHQSGGELGGDEDPGDGKYVASGNSVNMACSETEMDR